MRIITLETLQPSNEHVGVDEEAMCLENVPKNALQVVKSNASIVLVGNHQRRGPNLPKVLLFLWRMMHRRHQCLFHQGLQFITSSICYFKLVINFKYGLCPSSQNLETSTNKNRTSNDCTPEASRR